MKDLVERLNSLELALGYNYAKGDDESVEEINDEIYKVRQQIQNIVRGV